MLLVFPVGVSDGPAPNTGQGGVGLPSVRIVPYYPLKSTVDT